MPSDYEAIRLDNIRRFGEETKHIQLIGGLYAKRTHFLFELLQNAEDAHATAITFHLHSDRLEAHHDGRPFTPGDVVGICGLVDSTKHDDLTAIGTFGIGFKSVHAYTTRPQVHSGDEHFAIEDYVRPTAADPVPASPDGDTVIVLPFDHPDLPPDRAAGDIAGALAELDPTALLFLEHLNEIAWTDHRAERPVTVQAIKDVTGEQPSRVDLCWQDPHGTLEDQAWHVFSGTGDAVAGRSVQIALRLGDEAGGDRYQRVSRAPLVAFFATDVPSGLGFLLQAPFRTTPARDNVPAGNDTNQALARTAAELLGTVLTTLKDAGTLDPGFLALLPLDDEQVPRGSLLAPLRAAAEHALTTAAVLPLAGGGYATLRQVRAGTREVRDLVGADLLRELADGEVVAGWLHPGITESRTPALHAFLRRHRLAAVDARWLAGRLHGLYLADRDDDFLARYYALLTPLAEQTPGPRNWYQPDPDVRRLPLIRLEDGRLAPAHDDAGPAAYLPTDPPSDYPTVRTTLAADGRARAFLNALGLREPDLITEVEHRVLPRYANGDVAPDDPRYPHDLDKAMRAMALATEPRREELTEALRHTPFLLAARADGQARAFRHPQDVYWYDDDLAHYLKPSGDAWLLHDHQEYRATLTNLGVATNPRTQPSPAPAKGRTVTVTFRHGWHVRGMDGFHPDFQIDGLEAAMESHDIRRSKYIWNTVLRNRAHLISGDVQSDTRQEFSRPTTKRRCSPVGTLATTTEWLPDRNGVFHLPTSLDRNDLPEGFDDNDVLARAIGMRPSGFDKLIEESGVPADLITGYLQASPEKQAQACALLRLPEPDSPESPPSIAETPVAPFPWSLKDPTHANTVSPVEALAAALDRPGRDPQDREPASGIAFDPARRSHVLDEDIEAARDAEPAAPQRHRDASRRVWEGRDPRVRAFLLEQYAGRCQVCDATFPRADGQPYFEAWNLLQQAFGRWTTDRPGTYLCLCPTCRCKFQHGAVHAPDLPAQVEAWQPNGTLGDRPTMPVLLCHEPHRIAYTEKHLLDLQAILRQR